MDSRVLHFLELPRNSQNRVQGDLGRKTSLQEPVRIEVELRKEHRKDVNPR